MNLTGVERLDAARLEAEIGCVQALLSAASPGTVVVATRRDGALIRAALGGLRAGRRVRVLDPEAPADAVAPLLADAGLLLLDPEPARGWPLPPAVARREIGVNARPSAWQWLIGRKAAVESFPGCLVGLAPAAPDPALSEGGDLQLWVDPGRGLEGLRTWSTGQLRAGAEAMARAAGLDAGARILDLLPLHHAEGLLPGPVLAHQLGATLIRVEAAGMDLGAVVDTAWRESATHLVLTAPLLTLLLRSGQDLGEVFGGRAFQRFLVAGPLPPERTLSRVAELTGRPVLRLPALPEPPEGEAPAPTRDGEVPERVLEVAARVLRVPVSRLSLSSRAGELPGWDSLAHLDLIAALERAFDLEIAPAELLRLRTLGDATLAIEARRGG